MQSLGADELGGLLAIILNTRGAQAGEAMLVDGALPAQEFVDRKGVALASLVEAQQAAAHRGHNFGLAADNPAFGVCGRKIGNRKRTTVWPNHITYARPVVLCHDTLTRDPKSGPSIRALF